MKTSDRLRRDADPVWARLVGHPFPSELCSGRLPREKFESYILQDYHYLVTAMRNFSIIASRAPDVRSMREIIDILWLEATSEFDGYIDILERIGLSIDEAAAAEPLPVVVSYGGFLVSTSATGSYAEALAAVLPCFWSYEEIALHNAEKLESNGVDLYRDWGEAYSSDEYSSLVAKLRSLVDEAGLDCPYEALRDAFMTSSRYEHMFWEAVYEEAGWPV